MWQWQLVFSFTFAFSFPPIDLLPTVRAKSRLDLIPPLISIISTYIAEFSDIRIKFLRIAYISSIYPKIL